MIQDDLLEFHARHFPTSQAPTTLLVQPQPTQETDLEEDDGLGFYPDGINRTLTDDQIAIFRHSEIQSLLRERRQREEAAADRAEDGEIDASPEVEAVSSIISPDAVLTPQSDQATSALPGNSKKRKRKKQQASVEQPWTSRRVARELDVNTSQNVELDY